MATSIGKRKRRDDVEDSKHSSSDDDDIRARFQKAFEAKFKPLEVNEKPQKDAALEQQVAQEDEQDDSDDLEDSDWSGLSEEENGVEVVSHAEAKPTDDIARQRGASFMSSKPPSSNEKPSKMAKQPKDNPEEEASESANLKHDLALQRLLKESHLLDPSSFDGTNTAPEGKSRLKALDMRLQDLGAKKGTLEQEKMPLSHRKGIKAKAANREVARRKDAAENGIILEKAKATKGPERRRERGVGAPSVGKFKGGTLQLSSRDVKSMERPRQAQGGKKGKRR
ncbi:hypothetical protein KC332_g17316 [Hortaea werneckii]|uniref:Uncharacterized protein n=2 Tax=Hortaea werneckii TaxID=91943 RepID=A0A3M7IDQ8_HORWE|nr:hypothetical protein KC350_g17344 [Hortaea werneckii]OTA32301.1 hypothetical protein BTJ68_07599 [Hortaea werneckii EXF-2000]KAI6816058.1 hypothetical protein KC358_g10728 [Hortaea werneckii]KAI6898608.1 hypothetical protein KC348_g17390 [Hortaea werneckii]KAI6919294.1 hypothetical protein KC341_g17409 [Hortaea werneckii]